MVTLVSVCLLTPMFAQPTDATRIRTSVDMLGVGGTNILDTYLSQEKFSGAGLSYLHLSEWQNKDSRWSTIIQQEVNLSYAQDRSEKANELQGDYGIFWGRYFNWSLFDHRLRLQVGGMVNGNIGFIYNTVNSNNPAQARLSANRGSLCRQNSC